MRQLLHACVALTAAAAACAGLAACTSSPQAASSPSASGAATSAAGSPASSVPGSAPPATPGSASPATPTPTLASPLIVAIDPEQNPLASAAPLYKPASVQLAADGTLGLEQMTWLTWTGAEAVGTGRARLDDCNPSCAAGREYRVPVRAVFSHPVHQCVSGTTGRSWWSRVDLTYPSGLPSVFSGASKPRGLWVFAGVIAAARQSCAT